ncbi:transmembrane protein 106B-like [Diadema setosum]|uniref:transmembrane protein 106B-like n=1 Tax=Diadema setosum TaxID=31175 RepID=UPI003B3BE9A0
MDPASEDKDFKRGSTSTNSTSNFTYEELSNGMTCPTCEGTGKIPRGREDDLVALIPFTDDRLKPRRTWLYVFLSIFACAVVAGVLVAFLIPRPILLQQLGDVQTVATWYNTSKPEMKLTLQTDFEVYNYNFFSLTEQSMSIMARWSEEAIGTNVTMLNTTTGGRQSHQFSANVTVTITESVLVSHCVGTATPSHLIYMQFTSEFQYHLMSQDQQETDIYYKAVSCSPLPGPS